MHARQLWSEIVAQAYPGSYFTVARLTGYLKSQKRLGAALPAAPLRMTAEQASGLVAALVRIRLAPAEIPPGQSGSLAWGDLWHGTQFVLPGIAALGASAVIIVDALLKVPSRRLPILISFGLLALALLRPVVFYVEQQQPQRERDAATAREAALHPPFCLTPAACTCSI